MEQTDTEERQPETGGTDGTDRHRQKEILKQKEQMEQTDTKDSLKQKEQMEQTDTQERQPETEGTDGTDRHRRGHRTTERNRGGPD